MSLQPQPYGELESRTSLSSEVRTKTKVKLVILMDPGGCLQSRHYRRFRGGRAEMGCLGSLGWPYLVQ